MRREDFRVVARNEPDLAGSWGIWSDRWHRWLDVIYPTQHEATKTLDALCRSHESFPEAAEDD